MSVQKFGFFYVNKKRKLQLLKSIIPDICVIPIGDKSIEFKDLFRFIKQSKYMNKFKQDTSYIVEYLFTVDEYSRCFRIGYYDDNDDFDYICSIPLSEVLSKYKSSTENTDCMIHNDKKGKDDIMNGKNFGVFALNPERELVNRMGITPRVSLSDGKTMSFRTFLEALSRKAYVCNSFKKYMDAQIEYNVQFFATDQEFVIYHDEAERIETKDEITTLYTDKIDAAVYVNELFPYKYDQLKFGDIIYTIVDGSVRKASVVEALSADVVKVVCEKSNSIKNIQDNWYNSYKDASAAAFKSINFNARYSFELNNGNFKLGDKFYIDHIDSDRRDECTVTGIEFSLVNGEECCKLHCHIEDPSCANIDTVIDIDNIYDSLIGSDKIILLPE